MATITQVRVRQAGQEDVDAVTDLMLLSMQEDRDWWDYRFRGRHEHPDDHRKFMRLLIETWISPEFDNWVIMVAEVHDQEAGQYQIASFSAWDMTYLKYRRYGSGYVPLRPSSILVEAGAARRRDANDVHVKEQIRANNQGRESFLDSRFGTEQIHLQALGTHPLFLRRGLARALCRWGMDQAARDGVVVTLMASPMGRNVYPRSGFEELGSVTAQVDGEDEKTHLYAMAWDPKKRE